MATNNRGSKKDETLAALAERIDKSHLACMKAARTTLGHARHTGVLLLKAKKKVKRQGIDWLVWLGDNCHVSDSEAQRYMRIAGNWGVLRKLADTRGLTITRALSLLSGRVPGEGKKEAAQGEPLE